VRNFFFASTGTPPFPVVEANSQWLKACGMKREDVVGKTMKIIQGPGTEMDRVQRLMVSSDSPVLIFKPSLPLKAVRPSVRARLQMAVRQNRAFRVSLTNYTKQGVPFTNNLHIVPVDAVAAAQSYFYATSHITLHPQSGTDSLLKDLKGESAASVASEFCYDGFLNPGGPPGCPTPDAFFRQVRTRPLLCHLYIKMMNFTKTGSGQTQGKLKKETVFLQISPTDRALRRFKREEVTHTFTHTHTHVHRH
jgi:hypothetical protein